MVCNMMFDANLYYNNIKIIHQFYLLLLIPTIDFLISKFCYSYNTLLSRNDCCDKKLLNKTSYSKSLFSTKCVLLKRFLKEFSDER
jgi:hypothetical protein